MSQQQRDGNGGAMRIAGILLIAFGLSGCSLHDNVRGLANTALDQLKTRGPGILDTLGISAGSSVETHVLPKVKGPALALLDTARFKADSTFAKLQTDLAFSLEGRINEALQKLIDDNTSKLQSNSQEMVKDLLAGVRTELRDELKPIVVQTAGDALNAATDNLALAMEGALLRALTAATDSVARTATLAAAQAVEKSARESHLLRNIVIGVVVLVVALFAFALWREKRKNREYVRASVEKLSTEDVNDLIAKVRKATMFKFGRTELEKALERKHEVPS